MCEVETQKKKKRKKKKICYMAIMWLNWRIEITNVTLQLLNIYRFGFSSFFEAEIGLLNFLFYDSLPNELYDWVSLSCSYFY